MEDEIGGDDSERVGYRWLIDGETSRFQYALEPGEYSFMVTGVVSEPELVVTHFEGGEVVSMVDYTDELGEENFVSFELTVTADPGDTEWTPIIPDCVHEWDNGVVTVPPTVYDDGETLFTCEHCAATRTETIPALGRERGMMLES